MNAALISGSGLTRELADRLIAALETPMPRRFAATSCGVSPKTFEGWIADGASGIGDEQCVYLAKSVYEFEGKDVGETMRAIKMLADANHQAAAEYLRLMHPADFGGAVRTGVDEFSDPERNRRNQSRLLENPPPRMAAMLRQHRWIRMPQNVSAEDRATVDSILAKYAALALPAPEKADE